MRININAGGMFGSGGVAAMQTSLDLLHYSIEDTIEDLHSLNEKIRNVNGGTHNLEGALSSINNRIQAEEAKKENLEVTAQRFNTFLENAVRIDNAVSKTIKQEQKTFYNDFPWLRPQDVSAEPGFWEQLANSWNEFWGDVGDWVGELVTNVVEWMKEHAVELIVGLVCIVVVAVLSYVTGGAFLAVLAAGLKAAAVSALVGGAISGVIALFTGGNFWEAFGDGFASGFMFGGIFFAISSTISAIRGIMQGANAVDDVVNVADDVVNNTDDVANVADDLSYKNVSNSLTDAQRSNIDRVDNIINNHLKDKDFSGTLRDLQGNPVPKPSGGYWDHLGEMKNSYRGLQRARRSLENSLKNPNLSSVDRKLLQQSLDKAIKNMERIEELFAPYGGI